MDLAYWGFHRWPFDRRSTSHAAFLGASHEEALSRLLFLVEERRHCGMLNGAAGIGKSCLFRRVMANASRLGRICIEVDATAIDGTEFAREFSRQFAGASYESDDDQCWPAIQERMAASALVRQPVVLLVDHFDLVESGCSQSIRRLMHLASSSRLELTVLIAARDRFVAPLLLDVVELSIDLAPWTADETGNFISEAIQSSGATGAIFTADAMLAVHEVTGGLPADVVSLCDLCLLAAMGYNERKVNRSLVEAAAQQLHPRGWLVSNRSHSVVESSRPS